ncbi:hypothetical protein ABW21_db0203706 [Orbilia brochopaga]|nr:hypothetical protein ABW21_db0203706 [Drechslerella brochopaga]
MDTIMGISDPVAHKRRKAVLSRLFSRAQVQRLEKNIQGHVNKLCTLLSAEAKTRNSANTGTYMSKFFRCLAIDIISEYSFSEGFDTLQEDPNNPIANGLKIIISYMWFFTFFWPLQNLLTWIPHGIIEALVPKHWRAMSDLEKFCADQVDAFIEDPSKVQAKSTHLSVFQVLMEGGKSGQCAIPSREALIGEAISLIGAGLETTGSTLTSAVYNICINESIQRRLHDELVQAFPSGVDEIVLGKCEKLPYLTAVMKETLRIAPGVPGRLPRVVPKGGTVCGQIPIPAGTIIAMSAYVMHRNTAAYPDPHVFDPDRWIGRTHEDLEEKCFVPFSKGSRSCLGLQ